MRQWVARRIESTGGSVFEEIHALASQFNALNIGVGTPDLPLLESMRICTGEAMQQGHNQYAPVRGQAVLRRAVAEHSARFYGQHVNPETDVSVTSGVTEGLSAAIFSFVNPGDEVIVFEPFYDSYLPAIRAAGGIPIAVTLHAPTFRFNPVELRSAFTRKTRALLLNTPHNPTGTVFSRTELNLIAELCQEFDVLAITDEVYEHIVFDSSEHVRLATLPGMEDRTLTLSGAGKTFSCTGWRIGWAIGPPFLQDALERFRQFTVFAAATPFQYAIAEGLKAADTYFQGLAAEYQARRDFLLQSLNTFGFKAAKPQGSFFVLADISVFKPKGGHEFCYELAKDFGVVPVPVDSFYLNPQYSANLVRFTFCPAPQKLADAMARLSKLHHVCGGAR